MSPPTVATAAEVRERLAAVRARILAAGGDPERITVIGVTKGHGPEVARTAVEAGLDELGENYANELLAKAAVLAGDTDGTQGVGPRWHFLGAIQRNKVARLAPVVACWQAVSRTEEAEAIARRCDRPEIFVEVNMSGTGGSQSVGEPGGRGGCDPTDAERIVEGARAAGCVVRGLMTVAPLVEDASMAEAAAETFGTVATLAATLGLGELSMGMSHDLEQAVAAGSTMIRIGTALFGERPARPSPQAPSR
ncbi:MAG: YggS family pyridoxal phosphate enzyme, partial [Acidimicrobiales bacterium]